MPISPPTIRAQTSCKCGCGLPPTGRSSYHAGCFAVLKRCRNRLRKLKSYARSKRIPFSLTLEDILKLLRKRPDAGDSVSIERLDTTQGFTRDNLILRGHKGRPKKTIRRIPPQEEIQQMLSWLVERQIRMNFKDGTPPITKEEILYTYAQQQGRCAVSGEPLVLDKALHPLSLSITRRSPDRPWTRKNTIVVASAVKPFIDKWGASYLLKTARRVVKAHKASKKEGK